MKKDTSEGRDVEVKKTRESLQDCSGHEEEKKNATACVRECLVAFAQAVNSSCVSEHRKAFGALAAIIEQDSSAVQQGVVKGIVKLLVPSVLFRYQQPESRRLALCLVLSLFKAQPQSTLANLSLVFTDTFSSMDDNISWSISKCALIGLKWILVVVRRLESGYFETRNADFKTVISALCSCCYVSCVYTERRQQEKVRHIFSQYWTMLPSFPGQLLSVDLSEDKKILVLLSVLVQFGSRSMAEWLSNAVDVGVKAYLKHILASKTVPPNHLIQCCRPLLRLVSRESFEQNILPAVKKAMLRSPENAIHAVGPLFCHLSVDLSVHGVELLKLVSGQLYSKNENAIGKGVQAVASLASQCSHVEAVEKMVEYLFKVLNGQIPSSYRACVVRGVVPLFESLAQCKDSTKTAPTLDAHEGTISVTLEGVACWAKRLSNKTPATLISSLKDGITAKRSFAMKFEYLCCINTCFTGCTSLDAMELYKTVLSCMEAGIKQSSTSHLSESVVSAVILLKASRVVPELGMSCLVDLLSIIFCEHSHKLQPQVPSQLCQAMIVGLMWPSYAVRKKTGEHILKIYSLLEGPMFSQSMLNAFATSLLTDSWLSQVIKDIRDKSSAAEEEDRSEVEKQALSRVMLQRCLQKLCHFPSVPEDGACRTIALSAFIPSILPQINALGEATLWVEVLKTFNLDPAAFVKANSEALFRNIDECDSTQVAANAIFCLSQISFDIVWEKFLIPRLRSISLKELLEISPNECRIANAKEGTLVDTTVIDKAEEEEGKMRIANVKRESKAYSYKEQKMEMELRKELEEKKKRDAKSKKELTAKQQQAVAEQLVRESEIRSRILKISNPVNRTTRLFRAGLEGNLEQGKCRLSEIYSDLFPFLGCEVVAAEVAKIWLSLNRAVFPMTQDKIYGKTVKSEDSNRSSRDSSEYVDESELEECLLSGHKPLPLVTFAYCVPLLKAVLCDRPGLFSSSNGTETMATALKLIKIHMNPGNIEACDLAVLPLETLSDILIQLISSTDPGPIQQLASSSLLNVADMVDNYLGKIDFNVQPLIRSLLTSLLHPNEIVRENSLRALSNLKSCLQSVMQDSHSEKLEVVGRLWLSRFDMNEDCKTIGIIHKLRDTCSQIPGPVLDEVGRVISDGSVDEWWEARAGLGLTLKEICGLIPDPLVERYFEILVPGGINDRNPGVRSIMLQAAIEGVKDHGGSHVNSLLKMFEDLLDSTPDDESYDTLRQSLVVLLGTLARHLDAEQSAEKIRSIVARLIETLSTPSQQVQESVAYCLPPLVQCVKDQAEGLSQQLLHLLLEAEHYGERRGAAYGISGMVKGLGIVSLRNLEIMATLQEALVDKKVARHREGALLALEMLCGMLGKLFEPYIVNILPNLLISLGDHDQHVRQAAEDCAKAVMQQLSAHGVKLVLPSLLKALEQDSWRTKCGSIELLGAMAFCAPKQLSACLPSIVPKLIEVLSDTHMKVQKTGEQALKQIGQVIRNPEIQAVSAFLLAALMDPGNKTATCLQTLLKTKFVHYIDAPSLALLMPIIKRAFDDRSTETRRMAAQIIGNIFCLTDQKDVEPYLDQLLPGLKKSLTDPVPEVRAVSSRALGAMMESATGDIAQDLKEDILPWLKEKLVADQNPVDRSGAAQGLAEVFGALGSEQLDRVMPDIIRTAESDDVAAHVKDGYIMLYIYLPTVFRQDFLRYLNRVVPSILKALADENEFVRDTALKAGQRLINMYCETAIPLLIPQLERGLFDNNWRIRYSSVQLLGDFLFKISGVTGKMTTQSSGEDDTFGTESSSKMISSCLGLEERNRVFSGLYIARSDVALVVRQAAGHVWKVVVSNTPRTLKEILPGLFSLLLGCLASSSDDKQQTAARCLGELVKKMGERVLVDIVPVLEEGLKSEKADQRQGVCIALSEIMANTTKDMVMLYIENLVPTVRKAIYDPLAEVREAAASTFDVLHSIIGVQALDEVLLPLLEQLSDPEYGEYTLHGLQKVMAIKSKVVLPYLVPKLTSPPVNTTALSRLATASGEALGKHMGSVLEALLTSLAWAITENADGEQEEMEKCLNVVLSVSDDQSVTAVLDSLLRKAIGVKKDLQLAAVKLLAQFSQNTKVSLATFAERLFNGFLSLYASERSEVVDSAIIGLLSVSRSLDAREQLDYVFVVRQAIRTASAQLNQGDTLPGFCIAKGLQAVLPVLREGVLNGGPEMKETAAEALGETIQLSDAAALKPHVVNVTGPLIRVLGDRYSPSVKTTILNTLALFLEKVEMLLKPFLPQLQSTFLKALQEPASRSVRLSAGRALSKLIVIHPKPDNVAGEILKSVKNATDSSIEETFLVALRGVTDGGRETLSQDSKNQCLEVLLDRVGSEQDPCRFAAASALGVLAANCLMDEDQLSDILKNTILNTDPNVDWEYRHGQSVALQVALKQNSERILRVVGSEKLRKGLLTYLSADRVPISSAGLRGSGFLLLYQLKECPECLDYQLLTAVGRTVNHQSNEIKQLTATVVHHVARHSGNSGADVQFLKALVPMMVNGTKENNSAVRCASEEALVALLKLRENNTVYENYCNSVDAGAREALSDVHSKALVKLAKQKESIPVGLDDTVQLL